ncbi:hypothetical protein FDECE_3693 [Fusarium decemcellulare]|nr:hypothetical protein FDECE_3693 [Fusarium decemcellulare]
MRWISLCTVLGAALLPAASARPLCRPDRTTSSALTSTTGTSATESETATASSSETWTTLSTTTSVVDTTTTGTATSTDVDSSSTETTSTASESTATISSSGFITLISTTVTESATSTTIDSTSTTEASTTTSQSAEPTLENFIQNGDFEDEVNVDWSTRTGDIVENVDRANSPSHYVQFLVENDYAVGGNQLNQTINGLSTAHLFRLSFSAAVFDSPAPSVGAATCQLEGLQESSLVGQWPLDYTSLNQYTPYEAEFQPVSDDITITLRLRCTTPNKVTLAVGLDDVVLNDIGLAPVIPE